ncbi:MAG: Dabb family protein [Lentimicrobium sp.]|jgi:hypothetical protein|nr:Dabb family protein [Lentimicrobium sp.]
MLRHIVFFKNRITHDSPEAESVIEEVKYQLELLPALIPDIAHFEVNRVLKSDSDSPDLVLISDFVNMNAFMAYQQHPALLSFMEWNRVKCPQILSADYPVLNKDEQ